eukprot:s3579_g22.t1
MAKYDFFAKDLQWQCKPQSLPRGVKIFLQKSVNIHVDVMEVYSPLRVILQANKQNQKGMKAKWRVGQALDFTTGYDLTNVKTRKYVMNLIKAWKPAWRKTKVLNIGSLPLRLQKSRATIKEPSCWNTPKKSWKHPRARKLKERNEFVIDRCAFKLLTRDGVLARKPTMLVTNCFPLVRTLHKRCLQIVDGWSCCRCRQVD